MVRLPYYDSPTLRYGNGGHDTLLFNSVMKQRRDVARNVSTMIPKIIYNG